MRGLDQRPWYAPLMDFSFDPWGVLNEQGIMKKSNMDIDPPEKLQGVPSEPKSPTEATELVEDLQNDLVIFHINILENIYEDFDIEQPFIYQQRQHEADPMSSSFTHSPPPTKLGR